MQSHMHNMLIKIKRKSENGEKKKMLREKNWENFTEYNPLIFIPEILCFIDIEQKKEYVQHQKQQHRCVN